MVRKISLLLCAALVMGLAGSASALYVNDTQTWGATRIENLEGGGLEVGPQGNLTITGRVDMDSGAWLRMSGGILNTTDTFKFPDSSGDQNVRMYIDSGTFTAHEIEHRGYERNGIIFVGGGTLIVQTGYLSGSREYDPQKWLEDNTLRPDAGYDPIVFTDLGGGAVKITTTAPTPEIAFGSAASGDLETVTPALLTVLLKNPEEGQTYTVDYVRIGGTATPGEDYYMAGGGPVCWNYATQCHGDCDNDANVKGSDFLALKNSWYACDPDANYNPCADFDRDGCVKGSDFLILKTNWYQTVEANCPPAGGSATLTFSPGETSKDISIDIVDDGLDEEDETIVVQLLNAVGPNVALVDPNEHVYTIRDPRPAVSFALETGPSTTEDSGPIIVTVNLSAATDKVVTVDCDIIGGTATNGDDYVLAPKTLLTFNIGETSKDISIPLVEDDLVEDEETIVLELSNPVNAKLGAITQHTAKIRDPWASGAYEVFKVDLACPGNAATAKEGWVAFEGNQWCDGQRHDGRGISNIADTGIDAYIDNVPQGGSVNL
ncbi:MAG: Calx-beta domain-containing protein, partial [Planctomycetota bacterium]